MKQLNYLIIIFIVITCFSCSPTYNIHNPSWEKVYENDADGNTVFGKLDKLIDAVNQGKEVRILMSTKENDSYITEAENIWVKNGIVFIQNSSHISVNFNEEDLQIQNNTYHWYFTVSSKGVRNMSRWLVGEHTSKGSSSDRTGVTWFVK